MHFFLPDTSSLGKINPYNPASKRIEASKPNVDSSRFHGTQHRA